MSTIAIQEGTISFAVSSIETTCTTFYKTFGDLRCGVTPLVILHGGPGSGHEYMLLFQKLWSLYNIPVLFYDQIGCAGSTRLRHRVDDESLWQIDLFLAQLESVLDHFSLHEHGFDILGHSFGGILGVEFASRQPKGLRRLILAGPPASGELWKKGAWEMLRQLSGKSQEAVEEAIRKEDFTSEEYRSAFKEFSQTFWNRAEPWPAKELEINLRHQAEDPTSRRALTGPSPWAWDRTLASWTSIPILHKINVPTLVYNGEFDTAQAEATAPFFENIPRVRWVTLAKASHMHHLDSPELGDKVLKLVGDFLQPERLSSSLQL